jgi:hypothetical protein
MTALLQNGYWKRWQLLRGGSADGTIEWEETWWDASDYTGLKEMGAQKQGKCPAALLCCRAAYVCDSCLAKMYVPVCKVACLRESWCGCQRLHQAQGNGRTEAG